MTDDKKVCVAICNYNHSKYLEESIHSILKQTHKNLDVVVVDDGSTDQDRVKEIIGYFSDERLRSIFLEKNTGKWNALNEAFASTDAEICTSHDADDISLPWRIQAQVMTLVNTGTAHNLCGFTSCWNEDDVKTHLNDPMPVPEEFKIATGEDVVGAVNYGLCTPGINHFFTGQFETAGVSALFYKKVWDIGFRFNPPGFGLRILNSEDSDFNCRVVLGIRKTSLLIEQPYLYRRNTSTNNENK